MIRPLPRFSLVRALRRGQAPPHTSLGRQPFHEQVDAAVLDLQKPEALVEPQRGIEAFDVEAQQPARPRRPDAP